MDGTTAVVTGGTDGIGRAIADAFAAAGAAVAIGGRDGEAVDEAVAALEDAGAGAAAGVRTDVRDEFDVERLCETAARLGDGIDVVVAAADVSHGEVPLSEDSYSAFDDHWRTNARGVFATIVEALPHLTDDARVLIPTVGAARETRAGRGSYAVSKAGVEAVARGFAADTDHVVCRLEAGETTDVDEGALEDVAEMARWAATEADPDEVDGATIGREEWDRLAAD